jgi:hypothetical protein
MNEMEATMKIERGSGLRGIAALSAAAALILAAGVAGATDFIRGDANGDGAATISDAHRICQGLFMNLGITPECEAAWDANDDGSVDLTDVLWIVLSGLGGKPIPAPNPEPGPEPEGVHDSVTPCDSYGGGSPLDDPEAEIAVLEATAPGGADGTVTIKIALSNSIPAAGLSGRIEAPSAIFGGAGELQSPVSFENGFGDVYIPAGNVTTFALLTDFVKKKFLAPGSEVPILEITFCLNQGTHAGSYPLTLVEGEVVDGESGRAIRPRLIAGTLNVLADVTATPDACPIRPPGEKPFLEAVFRLDDAFAEPGDEVAVQFLVQANEPIMAYSFCIDFDETVLQATEIEPVWAKPDGSDYDYRHFEFSNDDAIPGSGGGDEGFVTGGVVFSLTDNVEMPADIENLSLKLHFGIRPDSTASSTELRFIDDAQRTGDLLPYQNVVTARGEPIAPSQALSFVFLDGRVTVIPDASVFVRGDSNRDFAVDLSDAIHTLEFLFLGGPPADCPDAADANDDGRLDISDPTAILMSLFLGGDPLPAPRSSGGDPTPDDLDCGFPQ